MGGPQVGAASLPSSGTDVVWAQGLYSQPLEVPTL